MITPMMTGVVRILVLWNDFGIAWNLMLLLLWNFVTPRKKFGTPLLGHFRIKVVSPGFMSYMSRFLLFDSLAFLFQIITVALRICGINYYNTDLLLLI